MAIIKEYLGWSKPILPIVADRLIQGYKDGSSVDLEGVAIALPGRRSGRRLLELLLEKVAALELSITPPLIITTGQIPELFIPSSFNTISQTARLVILSDVIASMSSQDLQDLFPNPYQRGDFSYYYQLASYFDKIDQEFEGAGLSYVEAATQSPDPSAEARWAVLDRIKNRYLEYLESKKCEDKYSQRRKALQTNRLNSLYTIHLVATADLNHITKTFLRESQSQVVSFIGAPATKSSLFDDFGCVNSKGWGTEVVAVPDDKICLCSSVNDELGRTLHFLAEHSSVSPQEISIGFGIEKVIPIFERALETVGVSAKSAIGPAVSSNQLFLTLRQVAQLLQSDDSISFASAIRDPFIGRWVTKQLILSGQKLSSTDLIRLFDSYQNHHLQAKLRGGIFGDSAEAIVLNSAWAHINRLLEPLRKSDSVPASIEAISEVIVELFGDRTLRRGNRSDLSWIEISEKIKGLLEEISEALVFTHTKISLAEVLTLLLSNLGKETLTPEAATDAVELLGWLEMGLDDAPYAVVTGMNEGYVPESINEDPILPDSLRRKLGLLNNDLRYARDAYSLSMLVNSKEDFLITLSKEDSLGEPLFPSRLLLRCDDRTLAKRTSQLFGAGRLYDSVTASSAPINSFPRYEIPCRGIERMSATSFKDYITCPFRFYLKHVLKLNSIDDDLFEMDHATFGTLVHSVLAAFANSTISEHSDPEKISDFLVGDLDAKFDKQFGSMAYPAVYIQREMLRHRLRAFAYEQAQWRAEGWVIKHSELSSAKIGYSLPLVDGTKMEIFGRVDRIDYNDRMRSWAVIDYKTGSGKSPKSAHFKKDAFIDLQLPLYYFFARNLGLEGDILLGYCNIPSDSSGTKFIMESWTEDELNAAYSLAQSIALKVRRNEFWPPGQVRKEIDLFPGIVAQVSRGGVSL